MTVLESSRVNGVRCSRRPLLRNLAIGAGILAIGSSLQSDSAVSPAHPGRVVRSLFRDTEGARLLGRLYLRDHPDESDASALLNLLNVAAPLDATALRHRIAEQRMADFRSGHLISIEGWLLARTEARACALAALA